jgi:hypothetical protein
MIRLTFAFFLVSTGLRAQQIEYFVEKPGDSLYNILRAKANGKTYTLIDASKEMCLAVADQRDWDGNGLKDALVERITACGGNCCPNSYFFVSAFANGRFELSGDLADSWMDPVIEKWKSAWSVVIVSNNEGINNERPVEFTRRFVLREGKGVKISESRRKDMESVLEMRSEIFKDSNEEHSIEYDLDGDGKKDRISGKFWDRWGRIIWRVHFANGKEFKTETACKRIGVLKTVSNGVHDLVCDQDDVYRWTGNEYITGDTGAREVSLPIKPSFDCAKASTNVELLICHDGSLAELELKMAAAYKQALQRLPADRQSALRRDHAAWFRNYARTCNAAADSDRMGCVTRYLSAHTAELNNHR